MEETSLSETEIKFIKNHRYEQASQLILKANQFKGLDIKKLAGQILSRQKAAKKLPDWCANEKLVFPPPLSVEQCSSEATALYKAGLVSGETLIDITGGMGVDCYYMSKKFREAHYFEMQEVVAGTASYNLEQLGAKNIRVHAMDSLVTLKENGIAADWIYADPARRNEQREKVVLLSDCTPDVVSNQSLLFDNAPHILVKTSPLLDIDLAARELKNLREVHVIGYEQECKELLFILDREHQSADFSIHIRILNDDGIAFQSLDLTRETERNATVTYTAPAHYLFEPHAAVLKAGAFKTLCAEYRISKLAVNSQLYTSESPVEHFPGRSFKIIAVCKPDMKEISKHIDGNKANLTIRNFPAKPEELRKKWKLKEGGDYYLFATTLSDNSKVVIVTVKPAI
jgi:mRNA-degrading endonuclease RelE of RelBE toxin-antitoxin system